MCATPRNLPVGGSSGCRQMNTIAASDTGRSGLRTWARASAMVASGGRMTGSGVIMAPAVCSAYDISRRTSSASSGSISSSSCAAVSGGQVRDQVGGVVGGHLLEDVRGALGVEVLEDLDLVLLGKLLEDVGEPLVVERGDHGGAALERQVVEHAGGVGGPHLVERGDQVGGPLGLLALGEALDVAPLDHVGLARAGAVPSSAPGRRPG